MRCNKKTLQEKQKWKNRTIWGCFPVGHRLLSEEAPLLSPLGEDWLATDCLSLKLTIRNQRKAPPRRVGEGFLHLFNIYSQLFGYYSPKNIFCERSSTLPPRRCYIFNNQYVMYGGIMGGIRVELHEVPP